jgi:UDP-N-acetylmuramoylalanine--D-glutamate ligase
VNDSKATNAHATTRALESFSRPIVLLAGGQDKGLQFSELLPLVQQKVRLLVVFGEAAERMEAELSGTTRIIRTSGLGDAVAVAAEESLPKDVVLLSPSCASFDAYASFEERGEHFRELVTRLPEFEPARR